MTEQSNTNQAGIDRVDNGEKTPLITLCIINYNGLTYLQQAYSALQNLQISFNEILVIDNASTDGSLEYLEALTDVRVIALESNTGPAGARNIGYSQAKNDIILFQDNDICLTEGVVESLYNALNQSEKTLITMPRVVYKSEPEVIQYEGANCHFLGMMQLRLANTSRSLAGSGITQTSSLVTACFMIDRKRYKTEHLLASHHQDGRSEELRPQNSQNYQVFDETLIFNLEDHDMGVRINLLGYNSLAVPGATVLHDSGTEGLSYRPGKKVSATRMYCLIRNRWWIILRYYSLRSLLVLVPVLLLFELWQLLGLMLKGWGREWMRALIDTIKQLPKLFAQRKKYQALRQRADREIFHGGGLSFTKAINSGGLTHAAIKGLEFIMTVYWSLAKKIL